MSPLNREIDGTAAVNGKRLGRGFYGEVWGWGPDVVKLGVVSQLEADNLNTARERMGDETFPEAYFNAHACLVMSRVAGVMYSQCDNPTIPTLSDIAAILESYGIQHRDLHGGNIMVTFDGKIHVIDGDYMKFLN